MTEQSGPTPVEPDLTLETEDQVTSGGGIGGRLIAGIVGAVLLLGGTAFAVTQIGSSGGPSSPEAAVDELLEAASNEDLLGVLGALDPDERDALRGPVEDLFAELERLEVLDASFGLGAVAGIDLDFADVTYRTEPVRDGLSRVYFTGGTVTGSFDSDEIPIGDFVTDTAERFGADLSGVQESETNDIEDDDTFLAVRDTSDGWRVSIGYTAAEAARIDAGQPLPAAGIEPIGADSPEAAVEDMINAATQLDIEGVIARLSPGEFRALQDYSALYMPDVDAAMGSAPDDFDFTIDELELRSETDGNRGSVFIDSLAFSITAEGMTVTVATDGECVQIGGDLGELGLEGTPFENGEFCADDAQAAYDDLVGQMGLDENPFADFPPIERTPELGISVARIDGGWYVAPIATGLDAMVEGLRLIDRAHLDAVVDIVEGFLSGAAFTEFEAVGDEIIDGGFDEGFGDDVILQDPDDGGFGGSIDFDTLFELSEAISPDADTADCIFGQLLSNDDLVLRDLIDSFEFDVEPTLEGRAAIEEAFEFCTG